MAFSLKSVLFRLDDNTVFVFLVLVQFLIGELHVVLYLFPSLAGHGINAHAQRDVIGISLVSLYTLAAFLMLS